MKVKIKTTIFGMSDRFWWFLVVGPFQRFGLGSPKMKVKLLTLLEIQKKLYVCWWWLMSFLFSELTFSQVEKKLSWWWLMLRNVTKGRKLIRAVRPTPLLNGQHNHTNNTRMLKKTYYFRFLPGNSFVTTRLIRPNDLNRSASWSLILIQRS